ncbi:dynein heavy chain, N-terminal region 2-domain-containing protein, partial [Pavlovales sp. CCMP2436]
MDRLLEERLAFADSLELAQAQYLALTQLGGAGCNIDETAPVVIAFSEMLAGFRTKARLFNGREAIFRWEKSEWPVLSQLSVSAEPYSHMWHAANEFAKAYPGWFDGPLLDVSIAQIVDEVSACDREMKRAITSLAGCTAPLRVVDDTVKRVEEARAMLPLVVALLNPGMRERHWLSLSKAVASIRAPSANSTLRHLIDTGLPEHQQLLEEVSTVASKEFALERVLERMFAEWHAQPFVLASYRETGVAILSQLDPIQILLDEHVLKAQAMRSSAFIKPFERRVRVWETTLLAAQEALDTWIRVQAVWLYLEPIFNSADITRQMPLEAARFAAVDGAWRKLMGSTQARPQVLECLAAEGLQATLDECVKSLEVVQRGLSAYLETKRLAFPRLFLLSNDELLQILAETAEPQRVQPHLPKIFEGVDSLHMQVEVSMREALRSVTVCAAVFASRAPVGTVGRERFLLGWA